MITATVLGLCLLSTAEPPPQASAPYQPSGWRPSGALFLLPARQQAQQVYGPPPLEYIPPQASTPEPTTTEAEIPTTEIATDQPEVSDTKHIHYRHSQPRQQIIPLFRCGVHEG